MKEMTTMHGTVMKPLAAGSPQPPNPPVFRPMSITGSSPCSQVAACRAPRPGNIQRAVALSGVCVSVRPAPPPAPAARGLTGTRPATVQRASLGKFSAAAAFVPAPAEFSAADIVSYWNRGLLNLGAPSRYDSLNADGPNYTQNYSYPLTYLGRQIGVLHLHYNTNDPAAVSAAVIGQTKLKRSDHGVLLERAAPATMIAAARAKHPAPVAAAAAPVCPNCGGPH